MFTLQIFFESPDAALRKKWFDDKVIEASRSNAKYHLYPIIAAARPGGLENHWTLLIHDTTTGMWRHYNSMLPLDNIQDNHYSKAKRVVRTSI